MIGAKGNSGDMVIKVEDTDNRRKEASYNDKMWLQRLSKARHPHRQKCQNEKSGGLKIR